MKLVLATGLLLTSMTSWSMMKALNTAATGMATQETVVNTISNNIANVNTIGFKKGRAESEDLLYETVNEAGGRTSQNTRYTVGVQIGTGSKVSGIRKSFAQGNPKVTNNPFDLMVQGEGFFGVLLPNGTVRYTRDGALNVNSQGTLVTKKGYSLYPGINVPPGTTNVNILENGTVEAFVTGQVQPQVVGQIPIFTFTNAVGLSTTGGNLYRQTASSGQPNEQLPGTNSAGTIMQGALESSNVSVMNEMTNLIGAQRAYEMNAKVMGVADQMLQTINNVR